MVPESPLEQTEHGLVPTGKGWFVLSARDAPWIARDGRGAYSEFEGFEGAADFSQLGINITILGPYEPMAMYHWEADQEDFLVLAVGARDKSVGEDWGGYTVDEAALGHGAGVEQETTDPKVAYGRFARGERTRYGEDWLPSG